VIESVELAGRDVETIAEQPAHQRLGRFHSPIQIHGAEDGLERVGEDGRLLPPAGRILTLAEQQPLPQSDGLGHIGQRGGVDHAFAQVGELALGQFVVAQIGDLGHDPPEHGITEELEPFVGWLAAHLGAPRPMGEGAAQQARIVELIAEPAAENAEARGDLRRAHASRTRAYT
jgi:hypothetical protein